MPARTIIESLILSAGIIACAISAILWGSATNAESIEGAIFDERLWNALRASAEIGLVAGVALSAMSLAIAAMYLYAGRTPPLTVSALALSIALTPDLVHALIWRAALQPDVAPTLFRNLLAAPDYQCAILGLILSVKWIPMFVVVSTSTLDVSRLRLRGMLILSGVPETRAFRQTIGPHLLRWMGIALIFGILIGLRQHELSDALLGGGSGFHAEGLSQWVSKVALAFLDPGRAAVELLFVLLIATTAGLAMLAGRSLRGQRP